MMHRGNAVVSALVVTVMIAGCTGAFEGKKIDYKSAGKLPPLEVPPDLAAPGTGKYSVPESQNGRAIFSEYDKERKGEPASPSNSAVLPVFDRVKIERGGTQRWLVVKASPDQLWPVVREFWQENGFLIKSEEPTVGFMETDWAENRARIPLGGITGFINKALDAVSSLPERDKFRTRLERAGDGASTEIYVSHKGMAEVYYRERDNNTKWQVRPTDPELEAAMLTRLAARISGVQETQAKQIIKAAEVQPPRAELVRSNKDGTLVSLDDSFDRAWRRVGLALDRIGFMVEDRNRTDGLYFVRYQDPDAEAAKKKGLSRLAFWRSDEKTGPEQYRIQVAAAPQSANRSEVKVLKKDGGADSGDTAKRILSLLAEQLR